MAKCRRNVENFLDACKKLGVPQVYQLLYKLIINNHRKCQQILKLGFGGLNSRNDSDYNTDQGR